METKANYVLIGVFVLAIVAAVFGFVYWFQSVGGAGERSYYRVVFESSVSGLRTGASVLFNGIRVGEVNDLKLNPDQPNQVVAYISVDKSVAVRSDTRIAIEFQGLTGIAAVGLSGGTPSLPPMVGTRDKPPTLVGNRGMTQDVTQGARDVLRRIDDFIAENQGAFRSALKNIDAFSAALARNSERIDRITANIETMTGGADGKSGEVMAAIRAIRELADNLDQRTAEMSKGVNHFTATGAKQFDIIGREARQTLNVIERTVRNIDKNPSRLLFGGGSDSGKR